MYLKKILTSFFLIISFINSYSQYYYIPDNSTNLLLIHKKGDLKISSSIPVGTPINFQLGYSPISHLCFSLSYNKHEIAVDNVELLTKGKGFSASVGTYFYSNKYKIIEDDSISNFKLGFLFDIHAGYNSSDINNNYLSVTSSSFNYNKIFIQTGFHLNTRHLAFSYAIKISSLDYQTGSITGTPTEEEIAVINTEILVNEPYILLESDFQVQFGPKELRGYVGLRKVNTNIIEKSLVGNRNIIFTGGLTFGINDLWKAWSRKRS